MKRMICMGMIGMMAGLANMSPGQPTAPATQPAQAEVPVKIVVLYSSGVGYFEHYGKVQGDASSELRFKTNQINDILKSLVLQDLDQGKVTSITYPSQDPLAKTLRSFQIDITNNPSLADLLNQLRGAKVTLVFGGDRVQGTILGVEKKQKPAGDKGNPVDVAVLNLISGGSIRSIELSDVKSIELEDPQLQQELNKALMALAQARDQDKKPVQIHFTGAGERRVRIGYVVETPIWKTSYRLILPAAGEANAKPTLQGWAIVENQTDNDWSNVQMSLVSGRPISFIQDLYQPLYIPRPVVQPELYASLRPQTYDAGMELGRKLGVLTQTEASASATPAAQAPANALARRDRASAAERSKAAGAGDMAFKDADGALAEPEELRKAINPSASVASIASAAKMGELFQYTVPNVSLPRQRSAMIPIVADEVEVERLSIYNASVLPKNPLNGARLKNTTGKNLLQGPVTVLDANAYAGDARIDNLPPNQERLLSYGIDLQMLINSTNATNTSAIQSGKIFKGVLIVSRKNTFSQEYVAENKAEKDKVLIIEHRFHPGWKLIEPEKALETADTLHRFKTTVPAGKGGKFSVKEEIVQGEQIAILPMDLGALDYYSKTGEIAKEVRDALAKAIAFKQALVDTQRQINEKQQQIAEITQEQNRIRQNMTTIAQNSDLYKRLLAKLNDQETKLEKLQGEIEDLRQKLKGQQKELEDYLMALNVG